MTSHQPNGTAPLCACGCGQPTRWQPKHNHWSRFVDGHQNIGRPSSLRINRGKPPLCKCGCGRRVKTFRYGGKGWTTYLNNHAPRQPHTSEAIEKMRQIALARSAQISEGNRARTWTKKSRAKASRSKLQVADQIAERVSGDNNPNWRNGHTSTYFAERESIMNSYQRDKAHDAIRQRDGNRCVYCGGIQAKPKLDVHHLDGNLSNYDPHNLVTLCHKHHMQLEFGSDSSAIATRVQDYISNLA